MEKPIDAARREASLDLARASLQGHSTLRLRVISSSMLPTLHPADVVVVQSVPLESLRRGDLIVIQHGAELITHRLVTIGARGWRTKGDNCVAADPVWPAAIMLGRVAAIERGARLIDLQDRRWQRLNRWLGGLNWLQTSLYQRSRAVKIRLVGPQPRPWTHTLVRLSGVPFRALIKLSLLFAAK